MDRRNFLINSTAFALGLGIGSSAPRQYGWRPPSMPDTVTPRFSSQYRAVEGKGKDSVSLIYKYYQSDRGRQLKPFFQTGPDCTSNAGGMGIELIEVLQHLFKNSRYVGPIATEFLHVGARQIIGGRSSGGVSISESVKFMRDYGVLFRQDYEVIDFTEYNYSNTYTLSGGIDPLLIEECKKHKIETATLVSTWDEARDAIASLQPVMIGSMVGFEYTDTLKRDKDGFVQPNGKWAHAWLLIGIDDGIRPGGCLISSWGENWVKGPKRHGQPEGSIWIDRPVLELMLSEYGDSYAINTLTNLGKTDYKIWK